MNTATNTAAELELNEIENRYFELAQQRRALKAKLAETVALETASANLIAVQTYHFDGFSMTGLQIWAYYGDKIEEIEAAIAKTEKLMADLQLHAELFAAINGLKMLPCPAL